MLAIIIESVANQQDAFRINPKELHKLELENIADQFIKKDELIAINTPVGNPQELYFTHRKGWLLNNEEITDVAKMEEIKSKGCRYLIISKKYWNEAAINEKTLFENDHYILFSVE